jgi:cardiolipin synthase
VLEAGASIHEYETTMLHHKVMVVDGKWATIGTTNFDNRSFGLNEESNVSFYDSEPIARLLEIFDEDWPHSRRITLEAWRRRGFLRKAQEAVASLLQDQV